MKFGPRTKSAYPEYAEHAAFLEKNGMFKEAAFAWTCAENHARKPVNRAWAQMRSDFCHAWSARYGHKVAA